MITIDVSEAARAAGRLAGEELRDAVDALRTDGFVVLNDVVDPAHLDILHERMISDLEALQARPDTPYNWNAGNLQQDPPPFPPYLFDDILLNPFVISVTSAVLGPRIKNVMYGGNTALPGDQRQPVHADVGHLWPLDVLEGPHPGCSAGGERAHRRRLARKRGHRALAGYPPRARRRSGRRHQDPTEALEARRAVSATDPADVPARAACSSVTSGCGTPGCRIAPRRHGR